MSPRIGPQLGQRLAIAAFCCLTLVCYCYTSPSAALAYQHPAAEVSLAVFSMAKSLERRSVLRIAYATLAETALKETGRRVDVTFVIGKTNEQDEIMMNAEQRVYGDLVLLPGVENMEAGKTPEYFIHASAQPKRYGLYLKVDDDAIVNVTRLSESLADVDLSQNVYFGHVSTTHNFMIGCAYGLSHSLASALRSPALQKIIPLYSLPPHGEDTAMAATLRDSGLPISWVDNQGYYKARPGWRDEGTVVLNDVLVWHPIKDTDVFQEVLTMMVDQASRRGGMFQRF